VNDHVTDADHPLGSLVDAAVVLSDDDAEVRLAAESETEKRERNACWDELPRLYAIELCRTEIVFGETERRLVDTDRSVSAVKDR